MLFAQLPVHGDYFTDLFPAFLLSGVGLALAFVPMSIGALTGVRPADAGVASGLINTNQQIGGAIGVALATTIATTVTSHYVAGHPGTTAMTEAALTHGFAIAFYVLAGLAALGAILAAVMLESKPAQAEPQPAEEPVVDLRAASDVPPVPADRVAYADGVAYADTGRHASVDSVVAARLAARARRKSQASKRGADSAAASRRARGSSECSPGQTATGAMVSAIDPADHRAVRAGEQGGVLPRQQLAAHDRASHGLDRLDGPGECRHNHRPVWTAQNVIDHETVHGVQGALDPRPGQVVRCLLLGAARAVEPHQVDDRGRVDGLTVADIVDHLVDVVARQREKAAGPAARGCAPRPPRRPRSSPTA